MMGCDAFADKNGEFEIEIEWYNTGEKRPQFQPQAIKLKDLDPGEPINIEILKGEWR